MDPVEEIKARLPIDQLVGQYCQLQKKGRNLVCLCPFHNDTRPSFVVSPDKGIAYCFACNNGGDIFSFYQKVEGVDFKQAIKDLAEKTGVKLQEAQMVEGVKKDEKDRLRACLKAALALYVKNLKENKAAQAYLQQRGIPVEQWKEFELGVAPDSFSATYEHLLKEGFSKSEILKAGLGIQKDLKEERIYDRFRHRLMFPIYDAQGQIVAFGGRTLGDDDAKYINSAESPLYHKSQILFGLHQAKEAMREHKAVYAVEGYFDVLACHRVGITNVVGVSGTAFTQQHARIIKRLCDTVILCLDQDRAGQEAAERAFKICSEEDLHVNVVAIGQKDPADAVQADATGFKTTIERGGVPYLDHVLKGLSQTDLAGVEGKRAALRVIMPLLTALSSATEREHYLRETASLLSTTETALKEDMDSLMAAPVPMRPTTEVAPVQSKPEFSSVELVLGLFILYPTTRVLLNQLIEPAEGFASKLYEALKEASPTDRLTPDSLPLPEPERERVGILLLYCEHHGLGEWTDSMALREVRKNCQLANHDLIYLKQREVSAKLADAHKRGRAAEEEQLRTQYLQLIKLSQMAK